MKSRTKLGAGANSLMQAFGLGDSYEQKGMNDALKGRSNLANARKTNLEADQLERSMGISAGDIAKSLGVPQEALDLQQMFKQQGNYGETAMPTGTDGNLVEAEYNPIMDMPEVLKNNQNMINRANTTKTAFDMGGGNVQQIMNSLLGAQKMSVGDNVMNGSQDANAAAQAMAAMEGKAQYSDGPSGIMDVFMGNVKPTATSRSVVEKNNAAAGKSRGETLDPNSPAGMFEGYMGKGSWAKLDSMEQNMAGEMMKSGFDVGSILPILRHHSLQPSMSEIFKALNQNPMFMTKIMSESRGADGKIDPELAAQSIRSVIDAGRNSLQQSPGYLADMLKANGAKLPDPRSGGSGGYSYSRDGGLKPRGQ